MTERAARATMLIHSPVSEVFDAFVSPEKITQFWLQETSGPLTTDALVKWKFMVPGATETVQVTEYEAPTLIAFTWSAGLTVRIGFATVGEKATKVEVRVSGFKDDQAVDEIVNTTEGFSIVLCDLKTLLELGQSANLVRAKAELIALAKRSP